MCLDRGGVGDEGVRGLEVWGWALPILWEQVSVGRVSVFGGVGDVGGEWVGGLDQGRERWGGVMSV